METTNYYEEKSKRKSKFENSEEDSIEKKNENEGKKENFTEIAKNVMTDAGLSVIGGGLTSAILGRLSLPLGILLTGYGHYKKNNALRVLGIGIMASASMTNRTGKNPQAGMMENMTERLQAFGEELKSKLGLDLLTKQKEAKKENRPETDLNGTEPKNAPDLSAVPEPRDTELKTPSTDLFASLKTEHAMPQPTTIIKEEGQKKVLETLEDYLNGLASTEERLL